MNHDLRAIEGRILGLDQTAIHDGPGVRMNVYLKGCPLRCSWCHSPDSQRAEPEVVWYERRCVKCGRCLGACPENVRGFDVVETSERLRCKVCGACLEACRSAALAVRGETTTAGAVADEAVRLKPFFRRTGGGVTLTGGEPTMQPDFAAAIASLCREQGIHVAVESCGHASWTAFERLLPCVALFLYDVKHVEDAAHRHETGVGTELILKNLRGLIEAGADVVARTPLIPGFNDAPETVAIIAKRLASLGVTRMTLLPFNPATAGKYAWIRAQSPWPNAVPQTEEQVASLEAAVASEGVEVVPA